MKSTKKTLLTSVLSLFLCFAMLTGTTFAWFTDVVSSNSNVIQSGTLDAEMYWSDDLLAVDSPDWNDADGVPIFNYQNWEPGYTEVKYIKVKNAGNLSFKWQITIEPEGEVGKLAEVIDVYYVNPVENKLTSLDGQTSEGVLVDVIKNRKSTSGVLLPEGETSTEHTVYETVIAIAFHMQESAGNDYKKESVGDGFTLKLLATQYSYEGDAFGNEYDSDVEFPAPVGDASVSADVTPDADNKVPAGGATLDGGTIGANVPAGVLMEQGASKLTLSVSNIENSGANLTLGDNEIQSSLDVHMAGVASDNTVPMEITLIEKAPKGMNLGNLKLYHVENGVTNEMTYVAQDAAFTAHNQFKYDPATGNIVLYMATFSEVALVADTENAWEGNFDYSWYANAVAPVAEGDPDYVIANADQLAAFGAIVGGMDGQKQDSFSGKTVKLLADINLGDKNNANDSLIFHPIGYYYTDDKNADGTTGDYYSTVYSFEGTFDGNGNTISNFYHNTWEIKGDYSGNYYSDAMGLFGYVVNGKICNLTVDNFSSDGEFTPTGVIAAYAVNSTFENIAITNCNPRVYNTGNGGIVGIGGNDDDPDTYKLTFTNITIDNTNKITALWGSWDVACGGLVGMFRGAGHVYMTNCHVAAQIDVYNDVCGNYQYYWYRYSGMMVGTNKNMITDKDGYTVPETEKFHAEGCTVHFGDWNDYYYCELVANSLASYTHDHQFSRLEQIQNVSEIQDGNGNWKTTGNFILMDGKTPTDICYHIMKDSDGNLYEHKHNVADATNPNVNETVGGETVLKENNQRIFLPFNQLFTGYGWGVKHIPVYNGEGYAFEGITILDRETADSVEKFEGKVEALTNNIVYKLGDIFNFVNNGVDLVPNALTVGITNLDENNPVSATVNYDITNWENGTITFTGAGQIQITIQDYYFCTPTTIKVNVTERQSAEKFDIVMNNGDFLHRVGNGGAVALDKLFKAKEGVTVGTVSVTVEAVDGTSASGTGTYTASNTTDWAKGTIQFSETGVVKVTITDNDYCKPTELLLEVVEAVNATAATSATSNNVVLLQDVGFSSLEVSGGYTLYGNGFTMTCSSDSAALDMGYAFVTLNNGTLDNVQIICPNFDYAVLYKSNMTESGNRSETTDRTRYFNVKSGVMASGNSQILNSRISGARAAVNVTGGNCVIDNSRIELGAVASLLVGAANGVTLRDVTLVQKPTASTYDSSKELMGFSTLFICDADGNAAPVTIEGTLTQNAWVDENDKQYVPSAGQSIISTVLEKTEYLHDLDGDGTNESLNLGFAYMPESLTSKVNTTTITDNRTDKVAVPYDYAEVSILTGKTYVYSYKNTNGTEDSFKTESGYTPNSYSDIITVTYTDTADGLTAGKSYGTDGWVYELNVDLDKASGYVLDFSKLSMSVNGTMVTDFKVNGSAKPTSPVAVTAGGTTYTLTATIDGKEYTANYKVTGTETSKDSPSLVGTPSYGAGFGVANKYGGDWSAAAPVLDGITVKYWSVADSEYKEFALSSITFANTGKQNGTNNYWEYTHTNNDFTLKLTNSAVIHNSSGTYGMPVAGKDGKLYFTISSSGGFVSTGTTSRSITIAYEFTDNNGGDTLKFSNTWSVEYNEDDQYNYSSFTNDGTLTKLLKSGGNSSGGGCVTPDTLITIADGTQKEIQYVTYEDRLLVWDFFKGEYTVVPAALIVNHGYGNQTIIKLTFEDGTVVKAITAHSFFDANTNKWELLDANNASEYIGHEFVQADGGGYTTTKLVNVEVYEEYTESYSLVSVGHYNFITEKMFSLTNSVHNMLAGLVVGEDMTYCEETLKSDLEKYGQYTYADFAEYITYEQYVAFNGDYLKISVEKGYITFDDILALIKTYL